jgi:hypothetical protein
MNDAALSCVNHLIATDTLAVFLLLLLCKYIRPLTVDYHLIHVLDH